MKSSLHAAEVTTSLSRILKSLPLESGVAGLLTIPVVSLPEEKVSAILSETVELPERSAEDLLNSAKQAAAQILLAAKEAAERQVVEARQEAKRVVEHARKEGYEAGYRDGLAAAQADTEAKFAVELAKATAIVTDAQAVRLRFLDELQDPLIAVCMASVKALLQRELVLESANIEQLVTEVLREATTNATVEVRVHPDDYHVAVQAHPVWQSAKFGDWEVAVVPDTSVLAGGCDVRFEGGRADATVEKRMDMLREIIARAMERSVHEHVAELR